MDYQYIKFNAVFGIEITNAIGATQNIALLYIIPTLSIGVVINLFFVPRMSEV